jgi:excisionase family DNA binding protein
MAKQTNRKRRVAARNPMDKPTAPAGLERAFTVGEIAQTGVACRAKLYLDIKAGRLKAVKFGRSTRITESAYRAYLESAPTL